MRYEPGAGFVVVELEGGELWVSTDQEGCQVAIEPADRLPAMYPRGNV